MATISLFSLLLFATLLSTQLKATDASNFGVCYTRLGTDIMPPPDQVVRLLDIYKIGRLRIYYPDHKYFRALNGSNVQLAVGIQNDKIYVALDLKEAYNWFNNYILPYIGYVRFRYIVVGHKNVIDEKSAQDVLQAMTNLYIVISSLGLQNQIKITTEVGSNVLDNNNIFQSDGAFKYSPYAGNYMETIVQFLASHDSPLFIINYPHNFFETKSDSQECGDFKLLNATNVFLGTIDVFYSAMEKVGGERVRLVVGETGWPSARENGEQDEIANYMNARKYIWDLADRALSTTGTLKRPGEQIETYVYSLFNGNPEDGLWAHFGMFYPNMQPAYEIPPLQ